MNFVRICVAAGLGVGLAVLPAMAGAGAQAQTYPSRPVNVVVPFPAGGSTDWLARMLSQKLEQRLKGTFVVENRPGGANVDRGGLGREGAARRPHPADDDLDHDGDQRQRVQESRLRPGQGFHPGRAGVGRAVRAGGQCRAAGEVDRRPRARSQGEARRSCLRLDRRGLRGAPLHGAVAECARHRDDGASPTRATRRACRTPSPATCR